MTAAPTRREVQREEMYADIVRVARDLLNESADLSLRSVAGRLGVTPPALYRYVANYQELVDLVAFEVDKAATVGLRAAAEAFPANDPAAQLIAATVEFRQWALGNPAEFAIVFANPVAGANCLRREMLTLATSGHLFTDLMFAVWQQRQFDVPAIDDLPESVREAIRDPLIPAKVEKIPEEARGLIWIYMQGWTMLYGAVALEAMGHIDPRVIVSGEMFVHTVSSFAPILGIAEELPRLLPIMRERITRDLVD